MFNSFSVFLGSDVVNYSQFLRLLTSIANAETMKVFIMFLYHIYFKCKVVVRILNQTINCSVTKLKIIVMLFAHFQILIEFIINYYSKNRLDYFEKS